MEAAIITSVSSLVVSLVSLLVSLRNQNQQQAQFSKTLNRALTLQLYEQRLRHYAGAFEATDQLQKEKGGLLNPEHMQQVLAALQLWKTGEVALILSRRSLLHYYRFTDALAANPALGNHYAVSQAEKIWGCKNRFRQSLRQDITLLYDEETG